MNGEKSHQVFTPISRRFTRPPKFHADFSAFDKNPLIQVETVNFFTIDFSIVETVEICSKFPLLFFVVSRGTSLWGRFTLARTDKM